MNSWLSSHPGLLNTPFGELSWTVYHAHIKNFHNEIETASKKDLGLLHPHAQKQQKITHFIEQCAPDTFYETHIKPIDIVCFLSDISCPWLLLCIYLC